MRSTSLDAAVALDDGDDDGSVTPVTTLRVARPLPSDWASLPMDCQARSHYSVRFCDSLLRDDSTVLQWAIGDRKALLVTTPTVDRMYGAAMRAALKKANSVSMLVLNAREETKSMELVDSVCKEALSQGLNRRGLLIGFGGGVCLDVVTVAASLIRRGVGHIRVPTTLIGQIDAGIGLKGAVNFSGKKSFIGCFHPPEQVLIDPAFLQSLPRRFLVAGIAEAVKMGIVRDPALFEMLESWSPELVMSGFGEPAAQGREVLRRAIWAMLDELRKNPYEDQTYERLVDFGHTFSPALEGAMGFEIQHGEAVAIDMALSATIARSLGLIAPEACERILRVLRTASLPTFARRLDVPLCREALIEASRHRGGAMNLVVPAGIGRAVFLKHCADVPDSVLEHALASLSACVPGES
ncbi:MAG TPA: sedoheptulose 7-phosphate cyclase [Myxococcales bacterium]